GDLDVRGGLGGAQQRQGPPPLPQQRLRGPLALGERAAAELADQVFDGAAVLLAKGALAEERQEGGGGRPDPGGPLRPLGRGVGGAGAGRHEDEPDEHAGQPCPGHWSESSRPWPAAARGGAPTPIVRRKGVACRGGEEGKAS